MMQNGKQKKTMLVAVAIRLLLLGRYGYSSLSPLLSRHSLSVSLSPLSVPSAASKAHPLPDTGDKGGMTADKRLRLGEETTNAPIGEEGSALIIHHRPPG